MCGGGNEPLSISPGADIVEPIDHIGERRQPEILIFKFGAK